MDDDSSLPKEKVSTGSLFLPSLAMSNFATGPLGVLITLLLIDIALTFEVSLGVMGQINTLSSVVSVIFGLFMGILSVRFKHKSLLITGLLCVGVSALGCFLATNSNLMLVSYSLSGVGTAMVFPMAITLIGEHRPLEKRGKAVGWILAAGSLSYLIGAPAIGFIADIGGWQLALLGFVVPISLVSLFLALIGLPSARAQCERQTELESYKLGRSSYMFEFGDSDALCCGSNGEEPEGKMRAWT